MQLLELFDDWQKALTEFNNLLKRRVKKYRQTELLAQIKVTDKTLSVEKSMTRSMYNARLLHPQYWPLPLLEQFAEVLNCPELITLYSKQSEIIAQLPDQLGNYIKDANTSNAFVIRLLEINQATFYAKQKDPKTWRRSELERIEEIVETLNNLRPGPAK